MTKKKLYILSLLILTFFLCGISFFIAFRTNSTSLAHAELKTEISQMTENISLLQEEKDTLNTKISDANTELSTKTTINNYFMEAKKKNDELKNSITDLKQKSSELDKQIKEKQSKSSPISSETKTGKSYPLKSGKEYSCPSDIPAGRYIATGKGTILISSAGKTKATEDLSVAYNNSYTFTLAVGEKIKATSDITLAEIK